VHVSHRAGAARRDDKTTHGLCADAHGFSLHAGVRCGADQRKQLEQLCRYITRPALANERLSRNVRGQVVLQLKSPYCDGTTQIVMQPQEFMQRLAALVPRPRVHLIRFHGVLAPHAKLRCDHAGGGARGANPRTSTRIAKRRG
jgi:Putative transposase